MPQTKARLPQIETSVSTGLDLFTSGLRGVVPPSGAGGAGTFLRANGTWSSTLEQYLTLSRNTNSGIFINTPTAAADEKNWSWITSGSTLSLRSYNDAIAASELVMTFNRSGINCTGWNFFVGGTTVISANSNRQVTFGAPTSGAHTINGQVSLPTFIASSSPTTGTLVVTGGVGISELLNVGNAANFAGTVRVGTTGTNGFTTIHSGGATTSGFVAFHSGAGNIRQGYIGFSSTNAALDSGTIPYVANLHAFTGGISTNGNVGVSRTGIEAYYVLARDAGFLGGILLRTGGNNRWGILASNEAESGSNAGSNFSIARYNDASGLIDNTVVINRATGNITLTGSLTTTGASSGIGYAVGAGGSVTQATNKTTGVTLNRPCGTITMNAAALGAGTTVSFVLTNSTIAATDLLVLNHAATGTFGAYTLNGRCAAGSATIDVRNVTGGSLSEAIVIRFAVIKAATT